MTGEAAMTDDQPIPILIEDSGGFTTEWFCEVPPLKTRFKVLRDHWCGTDESPIREVYEIEIIR